MKQKIKTLILALFTMSPLLFASGGAMALVSPGGGATDGSASTNSTAASTQTCPSGQAVSTVTGNCAPIKKASDCAVRVDPNDPTQCAQFGNGCNGNTAKTCLSNNPIVKDINIIVDFLSAVIGIVVIGTIILGGIQYSLAGDNSTATAAARQRIINGLIALVAFIFTFAFMQWLIPGGI